MMQWQAQNEQYPSYPSPEEAYIRFEDRKEFIEKGIGKLSKLFKTKFNGRELEVWDAIQSGIPIRRCAMIYHMSRYNIRRLHKQVEAKINIFHKILSNF